MPKVGKKHYPYTAKGMKMAMKESQMKHEKMEMVKKMKKKGR